MSGRQRATVQAPRRGEVECLRAAANFEHDAGQRFEAGGFLGDPERIHQLFGLRQKQPVGADAETAGKPRRMRPSGFAKDLSGSDPDEHS